MTKPFLIGVLNLVAWVMLTVTGGAVWVAAVNFFLSGMNITIGIYEGRR